MEPTTNSLEQTRTCRTQREFPAGFYILVLRSLQLVLEPSVQTMCHTTRLQRPSGTAHRLGTSISIAHLYTRTRIALAWIAEIGVYKRKKSSDKLKSLLRSVP